MDSAQDPYKKWGIVLIIFLLVLIPSEIFFIKLNKNQQPSNILNQHQGSLVPAQKVAAISDHSQQFYFQFKYNPSSKSLIKLGSGKISADAELFQQNPSGDSNDFSYKVEVISSQNELLVSGWSSISKLVASDESGNYVFRVSAPYQAGEFFKIYAADGRKLWEEKVN